MSKKIVRLRLPIAVIQKVKDAAKLAGVTPTQAFNVLLAMHVVAERCEDSR